MTSRSTDEPNLKSAGNVGSQPEFQGLVRKLVCAIQGLYPQASFLVAEAHKEMKEVLIFSIALSKKVSDPV